MQKVGQNDLKISENQFFVFEILIYFFVNVSSSFVIQARLIRYPIGVFEKTSTVSNKSSSNDRKIVEVLTFLATSRKFKKNQLVRFWNTHNLTKNQIGVWCLLEVFPSEMA